MKTAGPLRLEGMCSLSLGSELEKWWMGVSKLSVGRLQLSAIYEVTLMVARKQKDLVRIQVTPSAPPNQLSWNNILDAFHQSH